MLTSHSPDPSLRDPFRIAREAVLNGRDIPAAVSAQLAARGVDVGELEHRLHNNTAWRR